MHSEKMNKQLLGETLYGRTESKLPPRKKENLIFAGTYNILILENDQKLGAAVATHLTRSKGNDNKKPNFVVYQAHTYDEAVAIAKLVKIDIFILDIYLSSYKSLSSKKSGLNFAKLLKNDHRSPRLFNTSPFVYDYQFGSPVIFLTSEIDPEKRVKIYEEGRPHVYLKKPSSMNEIEDSVIHAVYTIGSKTKEMQLKDAKDHLFYNISHDLIVWCQISSKIIGCTCIYHLIYEDSQGFVLKEQWVEATKKDIASNTYFIEPLPHYLINPKYIDKFDEQTEEIVLAYKTGREGETELNKEKRISVKHIDPETFKIIAERMRCT